MSSRDVRIVCPGPYRLASSPPSVRGDREDQLVTLYYVFPALLVGEALSFCTYRCSCDRIELRNLSVLGGCQGFEKGIQHVVISDPFMMFMYQLSLYSSYTILVFRSFFFKVLSAV